jgi:hypothetical protein
MTADAMTVSEHSRSANRREMTTVLGVAVVAGLGIVWTSSRSWLRVDAARLAPFGPVQLDVSGRTEFPALNGLALVALLIAVLVLVTGGWVRRVLGLLMVLVGSSAGWFGGRGLAQPGPVRVRELLADRLSQSTGTIVVHRGLLWAELTMLFAAVLVLAGLALLLRAGGWRAGLSAKYAAPAVVAESADPWRRLDRGEDPTISDR